jgi:hypothetical protein
MAKSTQSDSSEKRDSSSANGASTNLYGSRGSGIRQRQQYDPNKWTNSISSRKTNVLCLGVSYPSVEAQLKKEKISTRLQLFHPKPCVEQAIELVRRNILTEMDGRDLARCLSLESSNQTNAYCASLENGAAYSPSRHLCANFNRKAFTKECKAAFGNSITFRQIILDYFWIPKGSWAMSHWKPEFFQHTLPSFVKENLLDTTCVRSFLTTRFDSAESRDNTANVNTATYLHEGGASGVVYLPFTLHCVSRIIAAYKELSECYTISFMNKSELPEHALWYATTQINPDSMQSWLGKAINQEDVYCTFSFAEVTQAAYKDVTKEGIHNVLKGIQNFNDVRMIRLQALRFGEKGGFVGLLNCEKPKLKQPIRHTYKKSQKRKETLVCIPVEATETSQTVFFFAKLMELVNEGSKDDAAIVSWNKEGTHFLIKDEKAFANKILQQHFDGIKYKEFERRLRACGFTKTPNSFYHKLFCRNKPDLSMKISKQLSRLLCRKNKDRCKTMRQNSNGCKAKRKTENTTVSIESDDRNPPCLEEKGAKTNDGLKSNLIELCSNPLVDSNYMEHSFPIESSSNGMNTNSESSELSVGSDKQCDFVGENAGTSIEPRNSPGGLHSRCEMAKRFVESERQLVYSGINEAENSIVIRQSNETGSAPSRNTHYLQVSSNPNESVMSDPNYSHDSERGKNCNKRTFRSMELGKSCIVVCRAKSFFTVSSNISVHILPHNNCRYLSGNCTTSNFPRMQNNDVAWTITHSSQQRNVLQSHSCCAKLQEEDKNAAKLMQQIRADCKDGSATSATQPSFDPCLYQEPKSTKKIRLGSEGNRTSSDRACQERLNSIVLEDAGLCFSDEVVGRVTNEIRNIMRKGMHRQFLSMQPNCCMIFTWTN